MFFSRRSHKLSLVVLLSLFTMVQFLGIFAFPGSAKAQIVVSDPGLTSLETTREVKTTFSNVLLAAGLGALIYGASYFTRKLAYDTARFVASGGKGQGALAFKDGFGEYLQKEALNSASSAIEQFGEPFGLNLCKPPDIRMQVFLQVGLRSIYDLEFGAEGGPQPSCKWSDFSRDWGAAIENPGAYGKDLLTENFAASINVSQTDFGLALGFQNKIDRIVSQGQEGASNERLEGQGFKSLTGLISGNIKTPAQVIGEETSAVTSKYQGELTATQIAGIYGTGAAQILPMAASVFLNTLVSQLLNNLLTEGLFPDTPGGGASGEQGAGFGGQFAGPLSINRERAEAAFSFLFTAVPTKELSSFNIAQLAACPDSPGIYNCVIDTAFQQAIDRARTKPLTIREAIEQNLLHGDWPLISPRREVDNTDIKGCRDKGYCYSNLQKLRKLRIVPLGFEIAALNADPDNLEVWTLKKVVDSFEDCARDNRGAAVADPTHPFCHLIDPNWIIKSPDARCEAEGYGNQLAVAGGAERLKECLDMSTCVKEGSNGTCESFSYCTREKNVWKIPGKACQAYNATCRTYVDDNNQIASYLSRTLDFGECTAESVGCRAYSVEQRGGAWQNSNQAQAQFALKALGRPQTVYFNDQIQNQTCPSSADGCSAFYEALPGGETGALAYFKKAPDYLGCYDIDPRTPEINFPSTEAELTLLRNKPAECANFSSACIPEEVACELYTPEDGGVEVTGIVGGNVCASECVGYDAYKQEATNFESAKFPLYFVPSNGRACEARNVGCDEFTNLDNPRGGGELREYYSDLKYCEKPVGGNGKQFYSWEGSEREGYVLRRHTLLQINEAARAYIDGLGVPQAVKDAFPLGSAAYYDDSPASLTSNHEICNQADYNILVNNPNSLDAAHPDCRALYDDQGAISYRMLTKTVTVSDQCHRLRKTESELYVDASLAGNQAGCSAKGGQLVNNQCQRCFNGGTLENGACVYKGIVAESASCPQSANQCRSYIGNTGNNIQEVYFTSFEPAGEGQNALSDAKAGWESDFQVRVRPEATQVGLYSLEVSQGSALYTIAPDTLQAGAWFELTFWAKGAQQNLRTAFVQGLNEYQFHEGNLSIGPSWREYRVGPVQFTGNGNQEVILSFVGFGGAVYYLDNVRLTKFTDHIYVIKNSWRTAEGFDAPLSCDSIPNDGFPGEALGCRAYKDGAGERVTFTGFEKLCRAEAVGCRPFYDTKNTIEETGAVAFNLWCRGNPGACTIGQNLGSCEVPQGERGCYVEKVVLPADVDMVAEINALPNAQVRPATIIIPADTPPNDPVYLARRKEFICSAEHLGCQKVALEEQVLPTANNAASYQFSDTYLKAGDPKHYETTLCSDTAVGCGEFKSANEIVYFKDPRIVGNKLCAYVPARGEGANLRAGWYLDGVGKCSNNPATLCRANEDCGQGNTCDLREPVACYPDYVLDDNEYGMWSQRTPNYAGYVGQCPLEENGCSEFLDPADVSDINPSGKPYYVIADEALNRNTSECNGRVSQKEGCVLFDRTDIPNKLYDAQETYKASENAPVKYAFVAPVSTQRNNTNVILKVNRDRECSEWLDCKTSLVQRNPDTGRAFDVCYELKSCRKLGPGGECLQWVDTRLDTERLNEDKYVVRNTSWYDEEYTGYSLFNKYNPSSYINVSFEGDNVFYLAYKYNSLLLADFPAQSCTRIRGGVLENKLDFETACGPDIGGRCYKGECIYPIDGMFIRDTNTPEEVKRDLADERGLCKVHPESNSPYSYRDVTDRGGDEKTNPPSVATSTKRFEYPSRKLGFEGAYICNDITGDGCSCEYKKVTYKSGITDYWSTVTGDLQIPAGICVGGDKEGLPCGANKDCVDVDREGSVIEGSSPGICSFKKNESQHFGLRGFCLEYDRSRPIGDGKFSCLTWLPVDASATRLDNYNNVSGAGYDPAVDAAGRGQLYCIDSNAHGMRVFDNAHFISLDAGDRKSVDDSLFPFLINQNQIQTIVGVINSQDTKNASVRHSQAGEVNPFSFAWMHDRSCPPSNENCSGRDYVNLLYSFTQWSVWGNEEWIYNDRKGSNALVTHVADLNQWIDFHDGVDKECQGPQWSDCYDEYVNLSVRGDGILGCRQVNVVEGGGISAVGQDCNIPNANKTVRNLRVPDIPQGVTRMIPEGISLREEEVMGVYYTPFVVIGGLSWGSGGEDPGDLDDRDAHDGNMESLYLTDKVGIDMDALRANDGFRQVVNDHEIEGSQYNIRVKEYPILDDRFGMGYTTWGDLIDADCDNDLSDCDTVRLHFKNNEMYTFRAEVDSQPDTVVYGIIVAMDYRYTPAQYEAKIPTCIDAMIDATVNNRFDEWGGNPQAGTGCQFVGAFKTLLVRDGIFQNLTDNANMNWGRWICDSSFGWASGGCERGRSRAYRSFQQPGLTQVVQVGGRCTDFSLVHKDDYLFADTQTRNKAWTDRTWTGSPELIANIGLPGLSTAFAPRGSLPLTALDFSNDQTLRLSTFAQKSEDAIPYACSSPLFLNMESAGVGDSFSCVGLPRGGGYTLGEASVGGNGFDRLNKLFIAGFRRFRAGSENTFSQHPQNPQSPWDQSGNAALYPDGIAPQIYSLNPFTCFDDGQEGNCSAAEANSFTVNKKNFNTLLTDYDGDSLRDEDHNRNGVPDPIMERQSAAVAIDFFAFADDNRMPIRRVKVDFGDDFVINEERLGLYKNRKPFCSPDTAKRCAGTQLTCKDHPDCAYLPGTPQCQESPPHFGDASDRSCQNSYFEFTHQYTCQEGDGNDTVTVAQLREGNVVHRDIADIAREAADRLRRMTGVEENTPVCVFRPKVQVLDNWGWCNGGCPGRANGCYNDYSIGGLKQCDIENVNQSPWTEYKGAIFVIKG